MKKETIHEIVVSNCAWTELKTMKELQSCPNCKLCGKQKNRNWNKIKKWWEKILPEGKKV